MHRLFARAVAFCLTVLGLAVPAFAQSAPKTEVSGGYQFLNFSLEGENESMPKGWYFDVAGNLSPLFGVVFQVGGNYKTFEESFTLGGVTSTASADFKVHEFLGGVRVNVRSRPAFVPFAQVLAGGINGSVEVSSTTTIPGSAPIAFNDSESGTNFALEVGGGVNFGLTSAVGLRVGADYLRVFAEDNGANLFRLNIGIVIGR
jgi:opacity protein-like surface antigen